MNNPIITASGIIPALSCVKVSTIANKVAVCTTSTDTVFGVTFAADTANGGEVVFQTSDTQLDIVTLRAGGTILAGDELVPGAAGTVVSAAIGQFVAMSAATSGQTLTAYKKKVGNSINNGPQVYGSTRASTFLKDVIAGTNSLDVIIFGDSNVGSALAGGYGYVAGMSEALNNLNATCYGTSLAPFVDRSPSGASRFYGNWRGTISTIAKDANFKSGLSASVGSSTNAAAIPYAPWNAGTVLTSYGSSTVQGTLTAAGVSIIGTAGQFQCAASFLQVNQQVNIYGTRGGTGTITGYTNPTTANTAQTYYIVATNGSTEFTLSNTYSGPPVVTGVGNLTGLTYLTQADFNDWLYFDPAGTAPASGYIKTNGINLNETHPLSANGVSLKLRTRYGTINGSTGAFYPGASAGGSANALPRILISTAVSLAGTATPTFTAHESAAFTATGKGVTANAIGYNSSGTLFSAGPGAFFCQSLYRPSTKGWAVHAHAYQSGDDSTRITQLITDTSTTWIQYQLQEIRERQLAAGGTGRVLLFYNSGINGADTGATWTAAHTTLWNRYKAVWASLGYPASDLAIVSIVGVQRNEADTSGSLADLVVVRTAANAMAVANPDMTVVDIKAAMPYKALVYGTGNASYYQRLNNLPNPGADITVHLSGGTVEGSGPYTATVTTANTITLTGASAVAADGYWVGSYINIDLVNASSAAPAYQEAYITQYNGTTKVATVNQWPGGQPTNGVNIDYRLGRKYPSDGYTVVSQTILSSLIA